MEILLFLAVYDVSCLNEMPCRYVHDKKCFGSSNCQSDCSPSVPGCGAPGNQGGERGPADDRKGKIQCYEFPITNYFVRPCYPGRRGEIGTAGARGGGGAVVIAGPSG